MVSHTRRRPALNAVAWINGTFTILGVINGSGNIGTSADQANGVNESGVIVGGSNGHAFIWDSVNHMRDMNTIFGSTGYGIIPSGWTLVDAEAIDDNGDIVGYGTNSLGVQTGFLIKATVPEPLTLPLAATAVAGLLAYAWRKRK